MVRSQDGYSPTSKDSIKGLAESSSGENDFSTVGVKQLTFACSIHLKQPESFWNLQGNSSDNNSQLMKNSKILKGRITEQQLPSGILQRSIYFVRSFTSKSVMSTERIQTRTRTILDYYIKLTFYDEFHDPRIDRSFASGSYTQQLASLTSFKVAEAQPKKKYGDKIVYSPQATSYYFTQRKSGNQSYNRNSQDR